MSRRMRMEVLVRKSSLIADDLLRLRPVAGLPVEEDLTRADAPLETQRLMERMIGRARRKVLVDGKVVSCYH